MREHEVLTAVLRYLGSRDDVTVWRNNTGNSLGIIAQFVDAACKAQPSIAPTLRAFLSTYRRAVAFGLPGSADVFGVRHMIPVYSESKDGRGMVHVERAPSTRREAEDPSLIFGSEWKQTGGLIGQFVAVECKSHTGRLSAQQRAFAAMIERRGGLYILARDVSDLYPYFPEKSR